MKRFYIPLAFVALLALLSLALNGILLYTRFRMQLTVQDILSQTRQMVGDLSDDTIEYTFHVEEEVLIGAEVPFRETFVVPIQTTVPISTSVFIPIDLGPFGVYPLDLPLYTEVPVDVEVVLPVSRTITVATTVPLTLDVPIAIEIAETPLAGYLEQLDGILAEIEEGME